MATSSNCYIEALNLKTKIWMYDNPAIDIGADQVAEEEIAAGYQLVAIDETVTFDPTDEDTWKTLTSVIPAGVIVKSVCINIETLVVAGGTGVKIGIGIHDGTMSQFGKTSALTQNAKLTTLIAPTINAGQVIDVSVVDSAGTALSNTGATAGSVRVLIVYEEPIALPNAV